MIYPLVDRLAETEGVPIVRSAEVLGFNTTSFYKWKKTPRSARERYDTVLLAEIREIHADDPEFGYRFIWDELKQRGHQVGRDRVKRLCKAHRIHSSTVKSKALRSKAGPPVTDDLLQRHFSADTCDVAWVADITEHPTDEGKWYFAAIKDLCSTRIVGYQSGPRMTSKLVCDALEHAIDLRGGPVDTIVHSDRGGQGGLNRSSQHLNDGGVSDGDDEGAAAAGAAVSGADPVAGGAHGRLAGRSCSVLGGDRSGREDRRRGCGGGRVIPRWVSVVSPRWRCEPLSASDRVGPLPVVLRA